MTVAELKVLLEKLPDVMEVRLKVEIDKLWLDAPVTKTSICRRDSEEGYENHHIGLFYRAERPL